MIDGSMAGLSTQRREIKEEEKYVIIVDRFTSVRPIAAI